MSVVHRPLDFSHFELLLKKDLINFDESWYG